MSSPTSDFITRSKFYLINLQSTTTTGRNHVDVIGNLEHVRVTSRDSDREARNALWNVFRSIISIPGTDKLTSTSDINSADRRFKEPLRFSKTQEPVVGKIDNDWPISDADPS